MILWRYSEKLGVKTLPINGGDRVRVQGNLENIETDRARDAMVWEAKKRRMAQEG